MIPNSVNSLLLNQVNKTLINLGDESFFCFLKQKMEEYSISNSKIIEELITSKNIFIIVGKFLEKISEEDFLRLLKTAKNHNRTISKEDFDEIASVICASFGVELEDIISNKNHTQERKNTLAFISHYLIRHKDVKPEFISSLLLRSESRIYKDHYRISNLDSRIPENRDLIEKFKQIKTTLQN